ncbi:alpha/beta hydrolase fold protein [Rhodomicrobium vannielii ATCC 17100]|uniref:Alpha/beta hydrolase fold protein n=1 Tax=Rhodomicrobium vannielii (strain ATCC 17100 / DSM 162 / LMG 4299 / NCIMB 10020 / ATH 3.1.1) TaxID=648757 RepID=E3I324_RHOVT|nr:alpha/beta hydrolase [Rhodomicrobium vannielii]ADP70318.1 alpha/beta hydrolase fold protein [Rhodomicrobium vannielii ATCC 17100]
MPNLVQRQRAGTCAHFVSPTMIQTALGPVECASYGEGPAIIALHGGLGGFDQSLLLARAAISPPRFRILAISRPGYLGTPLSAGATPEKQADLCSALLDALGINSAAIIAVSAGGLAALQFVLRHPERCWGLVLVSAATGHLDAPPEVPDRLTAMRLLSRIPFATALMRWRMGLTPEASARRSIAAADLRQSTLAHPEAGPLMHALSSSVLQRLRERLPGVTNDMAQLEAMDGYPLQDIAGPVLVVHGTGDRVVPFSHALEVANRMERSELMAIENGEHVSLFTHLDAIRERVGIFLARHTPVR